MTIRSCYVNIALGCLCRCGGIAALWIFAFTFSDIIQLKEKRQCAAIGVGRQSSRSEGVGNKTKDRASLERSERWGFCFVGTIDLLLY